MEFPMTTLPSLPPSHSASASMTGYLFQARYALLRALQEGKRHPSHALSIERFDDVAFESADRPIELLQIKHHARTADVSDSSVDLWKTLRIWLPYALADPATADSTRLILLTTAVAAPGSALSFLRQPDDNRDEARATELLVSAAKRSRNKATEQSRTAFLAVTAAARRTLVHNIWLLDNAPNIIDARDEIESVLHYSAPPEHVPNLTDHLEGWWFNRVVTALRDPQTAPIPLVAIQNKVSELRESFKLGNLRLDSAIDAMPPVDDLPADDRTFIRQMRLINIPDAEVRATVHDYYRAYEQRSRWAREHLLLDGEADTYDRHLRDAWHRHFLACTADLAGNADDPTKELHGRQVFRWGRELTRPFRNRDETWLSAGSLQMLADAIRIGWHPDYERILASRKDKP